MKRIIKQSSRFTEHYTYRRGGNPFAYGVRSNGAEDPEKYMAQITEHHPYSDADYVWARIGYKEPMSVEYIQDGKVIEYEPGHRKEFRFDWKDFYEDGDEYIRDAIERVCDELRDYNKNIESVIGYD